MHCVRLKITSKFVIVNRGILEILVYDVKPSIFVEMHHVVLGLYVRTVKVRSNVHVDVV